MITASKKPISVGRTPSMGGKPKLASVAPKLGGTPFKKLSNSVNKFMPNKPSRSKERSIKVGAPKMSAPKSGTRL